LVERVLAEDQVASSNLASRSIYNNRRGIMKYECQSCYEKIEDEEVSENSLGERQCPECGSIDLIDIEDDVDANDLMEADRDDYNPMEYGAIEP
jgi:hypothetical protein